MAQFAVKPQKMTAHADQIKSAATGLKECAAEIGKVSDILTGLKASSMYVVREGLTGLGSAVLGEASDMEILASALARIVEIYSGTETKLSNGKDYQQHDYGNRLNEWILALQKLLTSEGKQEAVLETQERARERERQQDLYFQSEIFNLLETDMYSKETWKQAGVEQRKAALTEFLAEINGIMGLDVEGEIDFVALGGNSRGQYNSVTNSVIVNENFLYRADSYQIFQTIIHEMRHAYQQAAVDHPEDFPVSSETVSQWSENLKQGNYKTVEKDGWTAYVTQPVEWDAKNFAKQYSDVRGETPEYGGSWGEQ